MIPVPQESSECLYFRHLSIPGKCRQMRLGAGHQGLEVEIAIRVDEAAVHTAVIAVANAVQARRIGDWQRFQQNRMHQRKNGGVRPNSQSDG
jgi:hypothetical protein